MSSFVLQCCLPLKEATVSLSGLESFWEARFGSSHCAGMDPISNDDFCRQGQLTLGSSSF